MGELIGAETLYIELVVSPGLPAGRLAAAGIPPEADTRGSFLVLRAPDNGQAKTGGSRIFCARVAQSSLAPDEENLEEIFMERVESSRVAGAVS